MTELNELTAKIAADFKEYVTSISMKNRDDWRFGWLYGYIAGLKTAINAESLLYDKLV